MAKRKASRPSRIFFIGAGFSAGLFYPVGSELIRSLVKYLRGDPQSQELEKYKFTNSVRSTPENVRKASRILNVIEQVLQRYFLTKIEDVDKVDVTEFFTIAHTLCESTWLLGNRSAPPFNSISTRPNEEVSTEWTLFSDLAAATRSYFNDIGEMLPPADDVSSVLARMRPKEDAIINFNWDEEVDIELTNEGPGVSYTFDAWKVDGGVLLLKPHGSIGWYDVKQGIGNEEAYFIADTDERISRSNMRILSYTENELPLDVDRKTEHSPLSCPPVITAPTFAKRFEYIEQQLIWRDVLEVCSQAHEFIFLGYSMPKDDFLTRAAVRSSLQANKDSKNLKCLIVDRSLSNAKSINFKSVFRGFTGNRNFFEWEFGCEQADFADRLDQKLQDAVLMRV